MGTVFAGVALGNALAPSLCHGRESIGLALVVCYPTIVGVHLADLLQVFGR